ncbi:hypothetical protein PFICI_11789 [Pestalotiopsis fici W106-1]|uniref:DUF7580 domain-containing protein n=1 Tax=Pestalotiopsis fici (strain W106-1 / CGMCC3.15140) TaxID=1229662 RepID=W3WTC5_PESFW|nr:uncharacterized protein PFICI_11789 [Pestalotiopsis fici W106-1]ETS76402.1 hypothetical protein PFICI_11789 [Pestalotiopsis fici W106-1]
MDPVSLILGITPLCISAIKGIKAAKATLKTLRHSKSELKRIRKKFTKETHVFLDECHLLLQEIVDPADVVFMIEEPDNPLWSSAQLDEQIKTYLGRRHDDFKDVMQDIHDIIMSLDKELSLVSFETTETTTTQRIKGAIDVTQHKSKWLAKIENINELNQDLKRLRKTAKQIQQAKPRIQKHETRQIPTYYEHLSPYTRSFYQALTQNWSCSQSRHVYHDLALFLGQAGETVDFLMRNRSVSGFKTTTDTVKLNVMSQKIADRLQAPLTPCSSVASLSSCDAPRPSKRLRVKDVDEVSQASTLTANTITIIEPSLTCQCAPLDLSQAEDVCGTISQKTNTLTLPTASVLYIDDETGFRHVLGHGTDTWPSVTLSNQSSFPLHTVLQQSIANNLSIPDQLRLALALARGMLLFNPSPWWQSYWSLENIYYFPSNNDDTDLATSLQTLHLSAQINSTTAVRDESYMHEKLSPAEPQDGSDEAQLLYGIRNLALYSLGVALLQIDRWSSAMSADDVVAIRRLARQTSRMGPRFQEVVRKCIDCDFGQGGDLEKPTLRNAVYGSVICEIEDLVARICEK